MSASPSAPKNTESLYSSLFRKIDTLRPALFSVACGIIPLSYAAAEFLPKSRQIIPEYFDHIGNSDVGYWAALAAALVISNSVRRPADPFSLDGSACHSINTIEATVVAGAAQVGLAINQISEVIPGSVYDHNDIAFGMVGATLGAISVSQEKYDTVFGNN